jgi:hypothetical protein
MNLLQSKSSGVRAFEGVKRNGQAVLAYVSKPQRNCTSSAQINRTAMLSISVAATTLMLQVSEIHALPETPYSLQSSIEYGITTRG